MEILNIIILISITISGTVFGSFFTLAVHRIPKGEDITHERSYCPKCNHKLQFLDLIPVWSYIFLGGKCRYCKEKIRPRYLILEIFSGFTFLLFAIMHNINIDSNIKDYINFGINVLFLCAMYIIAGIDKEKKIIPNSLIVYGLIISIFRIFYNYIYNINIGLNLCGFLIIPSFLFLINIITKNILKISKEPFGYGDIKYLAILGLYFGFGTQIVGLFISAIISFFGVIIELIKKKDEMIFGFYLSIGFIILMIFEPKIQDFIQICNSMLEFNI